MNTIIWIDSINPGTPRHWPFTFFPIVLRSSSPSPLSYDFIINHSHVWSHSQSPLDHCSLSPCHRPSRDEATRDNPSLVFPSDCQIPEGHVCHYVCLYYPLFQTFSTRECQRWRCAGLEGSKSVPHEELILILRWRLATLWWCSAHSPQSMIRLVKLGERSGE